MNKETTFTKKLTKGSQRQTLHVFAANGTLTEKLFLLQISKILQYLRGRGQMIRCPSPSLSYSHFVAARAFRTPCLKSKQAILKFFKQLREEMFAYKPIQEK